MTGGSTYPSFLRSSYLGLVFDEQSFLTLASKKTRVALVADSSKILLIEPRKEQKTRESLRWNTLLETKEKNLRNK